MNEKIQCIESNRIPSLLQGWLTLVEVGSHCQIRLEPISPGLETLSDGDIRMIRERIEKVNVAIRNGDIAVIPGLSTVRILNREQAIEALAPGVLDAKLLNADSRGKVPTFLATVGGQWIPPGITVELSPGETQQLLNLLVLGGTVAALSLLLESFGLAAPIAGAMAVVLLSQAAAVKICKELSATGAVGFKIAVLTYPVPFIVIPYPV